MKGEDSLIEKLRDIFVSFDVFNLTSSSHDRRISSLEKIFYTIISTVGLAVLGAWLSFILKKP